MLRAIIFVLMAGLFPLHGQPVFTAGPTVSDSGGAVRIDFTVSEYTDVQVVVEDASGSVVRHIGGGMLGPNAPAPFTANTLAQSLSWDKRHDDGSWAQGDFTVKVGLGLTASLDRFYGLPENTLMQGAGVLRGMAVDTAGNLIVTFSDHWRGPVRIVAIDTAGNYLRTLYPYPGSLPYARKKGFGVVDLGGGESMPVVFQGHCGLLLPEVAGFPRQTMTVSPQGWLVFANSVQTMYGHHTGCRRALIMGLEGACPRDTFFGPVLVPQNLFYNSLNTGCLHLALSPDGQYVYASGLADSTHVVFRALLNSLDTAQVFLGTYQAAGNDQTHFNDPHGVGVDASGNVYVADYGNHRVAIYSASGAFLGQIAVPFPDQVKIHRQTGAIYVMAIDTSQTLVRIHKYAGLPGLDSTATATIAWDKIMRMDRAPLIALHDRGPNTSVFIGPLRYSNSTEITRVLDNGTSFAIHPQKLCARRAGGWNSRTIGTPGYIAVDPDERFLLAGNNTWSRVDLATGAITNSLVRGAEAAFGPDGSIYTQSPKSYTDSTLFRYNQSETRIAFDNGAMEFAGPGVYNWGPYVGARGFLVAPNGDFYFMHSVDPRNTSTNWVSVYDHSCQRIRDRIISVPRSTGGMQIDPAGNIYITSNERPKGVKYPDCYTGEFFPDPLALAHGWDWPWAYMNYYLFQIGCLFKFPASGGAIGLDSSTTVANVPAGNLDGFNVPEQQVGGIYQRAFRVTGPAWQYFGVSPIPAYANFGDPSCCCFTPRFVVDPAGLIFLPDAFRFSVVVLDANKNEILRFGQYGNMDQTGDANNPIPLGFPAYVYRVNQSIYVSDVINNRVARVTLDYAVWDSAGGNAAAGRAPALKVRAGLRVYPVPGHAGANIELRVPDRTNVTMTVYAPNGRRVRRLGPQDYQAGVHRVFWNGRDDSRRAVPGGLYVIKVVAGNRTFARKIMLLN
jgi:hypothetical protein